MHFFLTSTRKIIYQDHHTFTHTLYRSTSPSKTQKKMQNENTLRGAHAHDSTQDAAKTPPQQSTDSLDDTNPPSQQQEKLIDQEPARPGTPDRIHERSTQRERSPGQEIAPRFDVESSASRSEHSRRHKKPDGSDSPDVKTSKRGGSRARKKSLTYGTSVKEHFSHVFDSSYIRQGLLEPAKSSRKKAEQRRVAHA